MMEIVPLGTVTFYYHGLPDDVQKSVADTFHVRPNVFGQWLNRQMCFTYTTTFTVLSLCTYCMGIIRPESKWKDRCHALLKTATPFALRGMGVPTDWETLALWQ